MRITTIATHIEPGARSAEQAAAVMALAESFGARVTALTFPTEVMSEETPPDSSAAVLAEAAKRGVTVDLRGRSSFAQGIGAELADHGRVSDLVMHVLSGRPSQAERLMLGAAVFDTGRPVLVLPPGAALPLRPARAVVAWDGEASAVRAAHNAMPFLARAEEVIVAFVSDDKELRSGDSGAAMAALLARHGLRTTYQQLARSGRGVLSALCELAAGGVLTMGCVRHSPIRDLVFGSATTDLFHGEATVAVLASA
ncbi:MAG: hypothetical protein N2588_09015 [Rhodovarius sp.]|nr:hypothetical protein [Rhodovarius sp.]